MTATQIIADCDAHDLHMTIGRIPGQGTERQWSCRIGRDLKTMRLAATFDEAVFGAWEAYKSSSTEGRL